MNYLFVYVRKSAHTIMLLFACVLDCDKTVLIKRERTTKQYCVPLKQCIEERQTSSRTNPHHNKMNHQLEFPPL